MRSPRGEAMKLLINAVPLLGEQTGVGNYARQIAEAAYGPDTTFFYGYYSKSLPENSSKAKLVNQVRQLAKKGTLLRRICKKGLALGNLTFNYLLNRVYDCYFEPNFLLLPSMRANHAVITIHDFSCFLYPQWHPIERVRQMEKNLWHSVERADMVITVSESIRREAVKKYGIPAEKIRAIPNGVNHALYQPAALEAKAALRKKYDLPPEFLLFVGAVEPRKNLVGLLRAHAALPQALKQRFPLIFAGSSGWNNEEIFNMMRAGGVRFLGYLPERDLVTLYGCASLFAYPSWYEGFGLPVLEAMACGCPVLASDDPALVELSAGCARHEAAEDTDGMRDALLELLEDEDARSAQTLAGLERARDFDWRKSAASHLRLFGEVCGC